MIEVYLQPLRDSLLSMNPIISQDDIRVIFSTLETIHSFSGKLLHTGEHLHCSGWRFEVVDVDSYRVDQVMITAMAPAARA